MEKYQARTCPDCNGTGEREHSNEDWHPLDDGSCTYECDECDECHGYGGSPCETCNGTGDGPDGEAYGCPDCDGEGGHLCQACGGDGFHRYCCDRCGEEIHGDYFNPNAYHHDGAFYCRSCAYDLGAFECETCDGEGELPLPEIECDGQRFKTVPGSCSCCGAAPIRANDPPRNPTDRYDRTNGFDWYVVQASRCDSDGVYYARLCSNADGTEGCLAEVLADPPPPSKDGSLTRADKAAILSDLLGDDTDGIASMMDDDLPGFSNW